MKKLLGIVVLGLFLSTQSIAKDLKNNFYEYVEDYKNAEIACENRQSGTFKTNHKIFLNIQKCLFEEDVKLIIIYTSKVPDKYYSQMINLIEGRHSEMFEAARTLSFAANRCESNTCIFPHLNKFLDLAYSIRERYFIKQQSLINKIYK